MISNLNTLNFNQVPIDMVCNIQYVIVHVKYDNNIKVLIYET